jgi:hypothetical protein
MDDHAGRLVDDEQMLVLPSDPQVALLGDERATRAGITRLEFDLFPTGEPVALRERAPVDPNCGCLEQPLCLRARADLGQRREKPVEPLACGLVGNSRARAQALREPPNSTAAKRIATPTTMKESARLNAGQ